jgi:hypothetical protein
MGLLVRRWTLVTVTPNRDVVGGGSILGRGFLQFV